MTPAASGWKLAAVGLAIELEGPGRFGWKLGAFEPTLEALDSKPGALDWKLGALGVVAGPVAFGWKPAVFGLTLVAFGC